MSDWEWVSMGMVVNQFCSFSAYIRDANCKTGKGTSQPLKTVVLSPFEQRDTSEVGGA